MKGSHAVRRLHPREADEVVDVLHEAFFDYPVMRFVLAESGAYDRELRALISFFVAARVHRDEVLLGIDDGDGLSAVALVSYPGRKAPAAVAADRERLWAELGSEARLRYESFGAACAPLEVDAPHIHLHMIGVRDRSRGRGLGRALLESVHDLSARDPVSTGVTLTTELPANVPLYEHFGYELVGSAAVEGELTTWGFFRPD